MDRKITFERSAVDTLQIARRYLPELPHRNLGYLCQYYEIPHHAHRALEDAKARTVVPKADRTVLQGGNRWTGIDRSCRKIGKEEFI
ncbi:MAG: exonuclease domain-containing protein [Waltera sp.]